MKKKNKEEPSKPLINQGIDVYQLYLKEKDKRLKPFKKELDTLLSEVKEGSDDEESLLSNLGVDIPKAGKLEEELFYQYLSMQSGASNAIMRHHKVSGTTYNHNEEEYLKDKEFLNQQLNGELVDRKIKMDEQFITKKK